MLLYLQLLGGEFLAEHLVYILTENQLLHFRTFRSASHLNTINVIKSKFCTCCRAKCTRMFETLDNNQ